MWNEERLYRLWPCFILSTTTPKDYTKLVIFIFLGVSGVRGNFRIVKLHFHAMHEMHLKFCQRVENSEIAHVNTGQAITVTNTTTSETSSLLYYR